MVGRGGELTDRPRATMRCVHCPRSGPKIFKNNTSMVRAGPPRFSFGAPSCCYFYRCIEKGLQVSGSCFKLKICKRTSTTHALTNRQHKKFFCIMVYISVGRSIQINMYFFSEVSPGPIFIKTPAAAHFELHKNMAGHLGEIF